MIFNFNAAEVFDIAVKIEENGKRFYDEAVKVIDDPEIKALFQDLGEQEVEHRKKFLTLKKELPKQATESTVFDPNNEMSAYVQVAADTHVFLKSDFESKLKEVKDAKSALKMAMEFEKDSVIFFLTIQDATDGQKGKQFIGELVKEEQDHLRRLSLQYRRQR